MKRAILLAMSARFVAILACRAASFKPGVPIPTPENSVFDLGKTAYGFFPMLPKISVESLVHHTVPRETYTELKAEAPETQIFVTFKWDDLKNLGFFNEGPEYEPNWEQIEAFEPLLDL